ncbi:MAG: hypothetical protein KDD33_08900 [Bdellovibrionales bacterium]|nr:hypothetical protein [Bdellovibrionales bacterium]
MLHNKWLPRVLVLIASFFVLNLVACSKAKFEATKDRERTANVSPDNVTPTGNPPGSGELVGCNDLSNPLCSNPGDGGFLNPPGPIGFVPPQCDTGDIPSNKPGSICYSNIYRNTTKANVSGVTVWLVVDSSYSFDEERVAVGRAVVRGFMQSLNMNIPVTISVISSHAPSGSYNGIQSQSAALSPNVFYQHSSEPVSIQLYPGMSSSDLANAEAQLLMKLDSNMQESPISIAKESHGSVESYPGSGQMLSWSKGGKHSGSDELGLFNFMAAMRRASVPSDHAWVVLFMSDENDVCMNQYNDHENEVEMYRLYCGGVTPQSAYSQAVSFAGSRPFVMGAMVYTGQAPVPSGIQHSVGRGYTDLVGMMTAQGLMIDLAAASSSGLSTIASRLVEGVASTTKESIGTHTHYPIYDTNGNQLSLAQVRTYQSSNGATTLDLQVYVDGAPANYTYDSQRSLIIPAVRGHQVEIQFCVNQ